jgi:hypothetical protein
MTEKNKMDAVGRGFRAFGLMSGPKLLKTWQTVMLAAMLAVELNGQAQANLINLYNWSNDTRYSGSPNHNVQIDSFDSAKFYGGRSTNNAPSPLALPVLTGDLYTTPGASYEIAFTMQNDYLESIGNTKVSFGGFVTNLDLPSAQFNSQGLQVYPVDINLNFVATSQTTDFTFCVPLDEGDVISLDNFTMMEVPEMPTSAILGLFGGFWLFLRWRKQVSNTKRLLVPIKVRAR